MNYILKNLPFFMLVFIRISAFMVFVPFFNNANYILVVKVAFGLLMSILIFPVLNTSTWVIPDDILSFILLVTQEILIGLLTALVIIILLFALELVGHVLGFQMAFSMARAVDTTMQSQTNIIGVFLVLVGTILFLSFKGDHYIIYTIKRSFDILSPGLIIISKNLIKSLSQLVTNSFIIGFKLASPAIILLLFVDMTLGVIGKTSQKMQIFFVGLPLKISIGMFSISLILGFIIMIWKVHIDKLGFYLLKLFEFMRL